MKPICAELESEIEARQGQSAESLRGVHEQVIRLVDNMVQNYLGNMRRAVQRFTNFVDNRRPTTTTTNSQPRASPTGMEQVPLPAQVHLIVAQLQDMTKSFREFTLQWSKTLGKQQSPLFDRIPPRGVELWRDFWDTVRKQVRRINEEFWQVSRDMTRMLTGRLPSTGSRVIIRPREQGEQQVGEHEVQPEALLYSANADNSQQQEQQIRQEFQEFYDKLTGQLKREQQRMSELSKATATGGSAQQQLKQQQIETSQLIDELDDEATRQELANNVVLRQQITQEINVFGSIFDIMRTFIQRLRESATNIRDVLQPPGAIHSNNPVTPGPSVKPTVDKLLEDTINSQRNINSQARPTSRD